MNLKKLQEEFARVAALEVPRVEGDYGAKDYHLGAATRWTVEAQTALQSAFPPSHAALQRWNALLPAVHAEKSWKMRQASTFEAFKAVFFAANDSIQRGVLGSLRDGTRAETVLELLDQAQAQNSDGHQLAATVMAGGALETHLAHLCDQHDLKWSGAGSIAKYDGAIAAARNAGTVEVYSPTRSKEITGWGGRRNDAAHDPTNYTATRQAVEMYIEQIRMFVRETSPGI